MTSRYPFIVEPYIEQTGPSSWRVRIRKNQGRFSQSRITSLGEAIAIRDRELASATLVTLPPPCVDVPAPTPHEDAPHYDAGPWLILSDLHCPFENRPWIEYALSCAAARWPDGYGIVLAGDLYDFGELSRHNYDARPALIEREFAAAGEILRLLAGAAERVVIMPGNHDLRFARRTGLPVLMEQLVRLAAGEIPRNIETTNYEYVTVGSWLIGHPQAYSKRGGQVAAQIALIRQRNVIVAHDHTVGMQVSECGRFQGWSLGHCTDQALHRYASQTLTTHRIWTNGAMLLDHDMPTHLMGPMRG